MKRRVIVVVVCLVLAALAVVAVRATSQRFEGEDSGSSPATVATTPNVVTTTPRSDQAAVNFGWELTDEDDFDGRKVDNSVWRVYDGANPASGDVWSAKQCTANDGVLTLTGASDAVGTTCGMAWRENQTYGRWEVRARFPVPADFDFNPVFLLWPANDARWTETGEIDFAEEYDPARQYVESWLHGPGNTEGGYTKSKPVDLTQWHNFAVEWQPGHVICYLDGVAWAGYTDPRFIPNGPMHLVIQQNYNRHRPQAPIKSTTEVDWVRIYR